MQFRELGVVDTDFVSQGSGQGCLEMKEFLDALFEVGHGHVTRAPMRGTLMGSVSPGTHNTDGRLTKKSNTMAIFHYLHICGRLGCPDKGLFDYQTANAMGEKE